MAGLGYTMPIPLRARASNASADESGPGTLEVLAIRTCSAVRMRAVIPQRRKAEERRDISLFGRRPRGYLRNRRRIPPAARSRPA